jgi:hypothetical protein
MRKTPIKLQKDKIEHFCKKHHIAYLALFGSILTSHFSEKSDIDVLVKFKKKHTPHLLGLIGMEFELSDIMGCTVDLKTPNDLSRYFRDDVLSKAKTIYGK